MKKAKPITIPIALRLGKRLMPTPRVTVLRTRMSALRLGYGLAGLCCLVACCEAIRAEVPSEQLLRNGGFEQGTEGWDAVWAREAGTARTVLDTAERHGGAQALRIEHTGRGDWSLAHSLSLKVKPGEIYELAAWVRVLGVGRATLGVVSRDAAGKTLDWALGGRSTTETKGWRFLRSR